MEHYESRTEDGLIIIDDRPKDVKYNWVNTSRFIFGLSALAMLIWLAAGCFQLYRHSYPGKPSVVVPDNTLYHPKYK